QHREAAPGQLGGVGPAAVQLGADPPHLRGGRLGAVGDLLLARPLHAGVAVQGHHAGQGAGVALRPEQVGAGARAVADVPGQLLAVHAVRRPGALDSYVTRRQVEHADGFAGGGPQLRARWRVGEQLPLLPVRLGEPGELPQVPHLTSLDSYGQTLAGRGVPSYLSRLVPTGSPRARRVPSAVRWTGAP